MSRKKTEINPIRAERVKKLIEWEGISQIDFAKKIFQTQQNVSRIINLKTALTEETAQDIISAFPEKGYRIEWLLGYDEFPTESERIIAHIRDELSGMNSENIGFIELAKSRGYNVAGSTVSKNGKQIELSTEKMYQIQSELCDFLDFLLSKQFQK